MRNLIALAMLALLAATPVPAHSGGLAAIAALNKFYTWYERQPNHEWTEHISQVKTLFDPTLYTMLVTVLHSEANKREPVLDFDPFVNAQWDAGSYAFGTPTTDGIDVRVPVTLTPANRQNPKTSLTAVLRKNASGGFVIYNLVYDPKDNLRDFLEKAPKK
jgi:hypothetical protein